ncbi:MAG TPA: hypothetical protein VJ838_15825 [Gaiellaceae bacterium]|nr:hypothetical protein [Gaiellaceae bacterium]
MRSFCAKPRHTCCARVPRRRRTWRGSKSGTTSCTLVERLLVEDPAAGADACAALWSFWWLKGHIREGRELLERAAALDEVDRAPVLKGLGTIAFRQGDLEAAARAFEERYSLVDSAGSQVDLADACADLARVGSAGAISPGSGVGRSEVNAAAEQVDDPATIRLPLHMRAAAARMKGNHDEARDLYLAASS